MKYFILPFATAALILAASSFKAAESPQILTESPKCRIPTFETEYRYSHAVFVGEVLSAGKEGNDRTFVFKVQRFWKGVTGKRVELVVTESPRYQAHFEEGKTYLVFAKRNEDTGALFDARCSRSSEIGGYSSTTAKDLEQLGEGKTCIALEDDGEKLEDG